LSMDDNDGVGEDYRAIVAALSNSQVADQLENIATRWAGQPIVDYRGELLEEAARRLRRMRPIGNIAGQGLSQGP